MNASAEDGTTSLHALHAPLKMDILPLTVDLIKAGGGLDAKKRATTDVMVPPGFIWLLRQGTRRWWQH